MAREHHRRRTPGRRASTWAAAATLTTNRIRHTCKEVNTGDLARSTAAPTENSGLTGEASARSIDRSSNSSRHRHDAHLPTRGPGAASAGRLADRYQLGPDRAGFSHSVPSRFTIHSLLRHTAVPKWTPNPSTCGPQNSTAVRRGAPRAHSAFPGTADWSLVSTPFCPQCGNPLRCACGIPRHDTSAGRGTAAPVRFDRDWVRPYIAPHEPPPGGGPITVNTAAVSWDAAQAAYESGPPPGEDVVGRPVVMSQPAGHRAYRPAKRRRSLRVTAALATLIGSAAIAGTYAFARSQDTGEATGQAPATRLDVLDEEDEPSTPPKASRSPGPLPSLPRRTPPPTGNSPARTAPSAAAPAPATGTSAGTSAAPAAGQPSGSPSALPASPAPPVSPAPPASPPSPTAPSEKPALRRNDSGPQVVDLQRRLAQLRLWSGPQRGRYDQQLDDAVRRFQAKYGVRGDPPGVYGPATRRRLESLTS